LIGAEKNKPPRAYLRNFLPLFLKRSEKNTKNPNNLYKETGAGRPARLKSPNYRQSVVFAGFSRCENRGLRAGEAAI
jgi:hypothetical protein